MNKTLGVHPDVLNLGFVSFLTDQRVFFIAASLSLLAIITLALLRPSHIEQGRTGTLPVARQ